MASDETPDTVTSKLASTHLSSKDEAESSPPPPPEYDPTGIEFYTIPTFKFACGATLQNLKVAYRSFNSSSTLGAVLIPTCYAGLINGTLTFMTAPNDSLSKYHVIVVAMLGNGESSSPSNHPHFPEPGSLRYQDLITAQYALLTQHLGITQLEAVVGFSMGGQQAYHWAVMYPDFMKRVVPICSSARTSSHNYAFLEGPIAALTNSVDYVAWKAMKAKVAAGEDVESSLKGLKPQRGLKALSRAYGAWLTSTHWFRQRLWSNTEGGMGFKNLEAWFQMREAGSLAWDADDMLILARMWQLGDIGAVIPGEKTELTQLGGGLPNDERYKNALGSIKAKVLLMPCQSDQYFPPEDSEIEMQYLKHGTLATIPSVWGHTAGGGLNPKDIDWMNRHIGKLMAEPGPEGRADQPKSVL